MLVDPSWTSNNLSLASKSDGMDFCGRFREIISDPLNLLIRRKALSGYVEDNMVYLHNGLRVPLSGQNSYYGDFSLILVYNRGVHEPLEEYVFQQILDKLSPNPVMLELGAYWAHYSMWLKLMRPRATTYLVEPDVANMSVGISNYEANNFEGVFFNEKVGNSFFQVDSFMSRTGLESINILHSDIQGFEYEMLEGASLALSNHRIDYLFVSTHSQRLHYQVVALLRSHGYRIEVSSDVDYHTTSCDGFVFASSPLSSQVFTNFLPMGRMDIVSSSPSDISSYISSLVR